jgi:hypothetical protein
MEQRVSLVTLGVRDLERARARSTWRSGGRRADPGDDVVFFQTGGMVVALWGRAYKHGPGLRRGRRVRVRSVRSEATCGLQSTKGQLYALFLQRRNHRWHSNLCLTTTPRRMRRAANSVAASLPASPGSAGCG